MKGKRSRKASGRARGKARVLPLSAKPTPSLGPVAVYELAISEEIGWSTTAAGVREQLSVAGEEEELLVRINSAGGFVTEGMAIYAALRRHKGKTVAVVEGIAASMASVILQAADERRVCKGSFVMIHNPWAGVTGDADELRKQAELLDKMTNELLDIYESRCKGKTDRKKLAKLMEEETYMTAEEAVEYGLADSVDDAEARIELQAVAKLNPEKIPESLRALLNKGKSPMTKAERKARIAALQAEAAKLKAEETEEETSDEEEEEENPSDSEETEEEESNEEDDDDEKAAAASVLKVVRRITGKRSLAEAEGALVAIGHTAKTGQTGNRAKAVSELVASGKLAPADKKWALNCSDQAFASYQKTVAKVTVIGAPVVQPAAKGTITAPGATTDELTPEERKVMKAMGRTKEQMIAARAANPLTTKETA